MRTMQRELLVKVKNIGFCFAVDAMKKHNYVHPAYLSFFNASTKPCVKKASSETVLADGYSPFENIEPINFSDVIQYCDKRLALCLDNKLRICREYRITFECEDRILSLPFVLDKSLKFPGVFGKVALESLKK